MVYLLDANVLIDANRDYYSMERVPEFWDWLCHQGSRSRIKIPQEVFEEIRRGNNGLARWIRGDRARGALLLGEEVEVDLVRRVVEEGYGDNLTDDQIALLGRDPFLVAYALADSGTRTIVTTEVSKPTRQGANRHLPDVCDDLGVSWCNTFSLAQQLDFTTSWTATSDDVE